MPYTAKEHKLYASLVKQYGAKKGKSVYHAMANTGKYGKIFGARTKAKKRGKKLPFQSEHTRIR